MRRFELSTLLLLIAASGCALFDPGESENARVAFRHTDRTELDPKPPLRITFTLPAQREDPHALGFL
jgi:hypothetical protein